MGDIKRIVKNKKCDYRSKIIHGIKEKRDRKWHLGYKAMHHKEQIRVILYVSSLHRNWISYIQVTKFMFSSGPYSSCPERQMLT